MLPTIVKQQAAELRSRLYVIRETPEVRVVREALEYLKGEAYRALRSGKALEDYSNANGALGALEKLEEWITKESQLKNLEKREG